MKRFLLLLLCLAVFGCGQADVAPVASPAPSDAPESIHIVQASTAPPATAQPVPTDTPSPSPTPSPTPDPYRSEPLTVCEQDAAFWYCAPNAALQGYITGMSFPEDPSDCPVAMDALRYIHLLYVDFDGVSHEGALLVHRNLADEVMDIFYQLYAAGYPLASVRLVDDFGQPFTDGLSMEANNTSAFCCRRVTGKRYFSRHSYGYAIDVNPMMNPYIRPDGSFAPDNSAPYLDRSEIRTGMIDENDLCYRLFTAYGWGWGGHFKGEKDYQHFSKDPNA